MQRALVIVITVGLCACRGGADESDHFDAGAGDGGGDADEDRDVVWDPGDPCSYSTDYEDGECLDAATLMVCDRTDTVVTLDCDSQCGGSGACVLAIRDADYCECRAP